ncbi:MAG: PHP domain-containing protein [Clostridiales bacterium]|nr:PHP domain-containing protein [Clostridiales bacterium]
MRVFCDLHIHSCLSPCGDEMMTPNNIARMALIKGLDAIAVTDHNSAKNLPALQVACDRAGILLLPGLELNTSEEVHVLAYFPTVERALDFSGEIHPLLPPIPNRPDLFGEQLVTDADDEVTGREEVLLIGALSRTLDELVNRVNALGGAAVPAHVNRGSNGLLNALGFLPPNLPVSAVEVWRALPCPDLGNLMALYSSDAHRLEDMLEREVFFDLPERSVPALFNFIKKGDQHDHQL